MAGLSIRAYAKHRGCHEATVRKHLRAGKITARADGSIDPVAADAEWETNIRVPAPPKAGTHDHGSTHDDDLHEVDAYLGARTRFEAEKKAAAGSTETLIEAERRKEIALANLRELEYGQKAALLVERAAVANAWFTAYRSIRDRMMGRSGQLAESLAAIASEAILEAVRTNGKVVPDLTPVFRRMMETADRETVSKMADEIAGLGEAHAADPEG